MKPPTEADLIELENVVCKPLATMTDTNTGFNQNDRVLRTIRYLIDRARFHNRRAIGRTEPGKDRTGQKQGGV